MDNGKTKSAKTNGAPLNAGKRTAKAPARKTADTKNSKKSVVIVMAPQNSDKGGRKTRPRRRTSESRGYKNTRSCSRTPMLSKADATLMVRYMIAEKGWKNYGALAFENDVLSLKGVCLDECATSIDDRLSLSATVGEILKDAKVWAKKQAARIAKEKEEQEDELEP